MTVVLIAVAAFVSGLWVGRGARVRDAETRHWDHERLLGEATAADRLFDELVEAEKELAKKDRQLTWARNKLRKVAA